MRTIYTPGARKRRRFWPLALIGAAACAGAAEPELPALVVAAPAERSSAQLGLKLPASAASHLGLTPLETPAAIYLITSEQMHERGLRTTQQALATAPGVLSGQCFGFTCVTMRGFAQALSVPFLFDGLRYPGLAMSPRGTFVYDRIEVIKGPASVLHGLGTVTGAVNFVAKSADGVPRRELFVATDRWQAHNLGLDLGGTLHNGWAYRLAFNAIDAERGSSGWVERTGYRYVHALAEVGLQLRPDLRLTLAAQLSDDEGQWYFGTPLVAGRLDQRVRERNFNVADSTMRKRVGWLRARLDYQWSPTVRVRNETYANDEQRLWRNAELHRFNPSTGRVDLGDFLHIEHDQALLGNRTEVAFEHQLLGRANRLLVGWDWSRNRHQRNNNAPFAAPPVALDFLAPQPLPFVSISPFMPLRRSVLDQQALYFENLTQLAPQWRLSWSGRHDRIELDAHELRSGVQFQRRWSANSWRLGAVYAWRPGLNLYAQTARAFEPPAQVVNLAPAQRAFELTRARHHELGVKGLLAQGQGEFTLAWFDTVRSDILTRDPNRPGQTVQIGQQSSRGLEFDLLWHLDPHWSLGLNGTRLQAQFDQFYENVAGTAVSRAGLLPPDTPEQLTNLRLAWQPSALWRLQAQVRHVGQRWGDNANTVVLPSYTALDLSVAHWIGTGELALHLRNATDRVYLSRSAGGGAQALLGEPRALEISYRVLF